MLKNIFLVFFQLAITGTLFGLLLVFLKKWLAKRYTARSRCLLWLLISLWLFIPVNLILPDIIGINLTTSGAYSQSKSNPQSSNSIKASDEHSKQYNPNRSSAYKKFNFVQLFQIFLSILSALWLAGVFIYAIIQILRYKYFLSYLHDGVRDCNKELLKKFDEIKFSLCIKGKITLNMTKNAQTPMLTGILNPTIWIPENIPSSDLDMIFRHEFTHYKNKDLYLKLLWTIAHTIHWYNPFVRFIEKSVNEDIEFSCDSYVVHNLNNSERYEYGEIILRCACNNKCNTYLTSCVSDSKEAIMKRLDNLFYVNRKKHCIGIFAILVLILTTVGITFNAKAVPSSEKTVNGVIQDALMNTIVVKDDNGNIYQFNKGDANISAGNDGLTIGEQVSIKYRGTLNNKQDYQDVTLISITSDESEKTISGTVQDALMSTIIIKTDDSQTYEFDKSNAKIISDGSGITIGSKVTISYIGHLNPDSNAQSVQVNSITVK